MELISKRLGDIAYDMKLIADNLEVVAAGLDPESSRDETEGNAVRAIATMLRERIGSLMDIDQELLEGKL